MRRTPTPLRILARDAIVWAVTHAFLMGVAKSALVLAKVVDAIEEG